MGSGPPVLSQRFTGWQPNTQDQIWEVSDVNQSIEPAAPRPYWTAGKVLLAIAVVIAVLLAGIFIGSSNLGSKAPSAATSTVTRAASTPSAAPFAPITLSGQGSKVTDSVHLPAGAYRVSWTAQGGEDNFIVHVH